MKHENVLMVGHNPGITFCRSHADAAATKHGLAAVRMRKGRSIARSIWRNSPATLA